MSYRRFCATIYGKWSIDDYDEKKVKYIIAGREVCPDTERKHWQVYFETVDKVRPSAARKSIAGGKCHIEPCHKGQKANIEYCKKDGEYEERGEPKKQGERVDLKKVAALLKSGMSLREVAEECPTEFFKYGRGIREWSALVDEVKMEKPEIVLKKWQKAVIELIERGFKKRQIIWIWSKESGTGKSTFQDYLFAEYGRRVCKGNWSWKHFLNGYKKEEDIITFNLERDVELHKTHTAVLEKVSDGTVHRGEMYEGAMKIVKGVVLVFANVPPPHGSLPDRFIEFGLDPRAKVRDWDGESSSDSE